MKYRRLLLSLSVFVGTAMATVQFSQQFSLGAEADDKAAKRPTVTSLPRVSPAVQNALAGREFAKAIKLIDAQLQKDDVVAPDYLLYLRGRANTELRTFDDALLTFETLEKRYPKSVWISRARFGQADVFARQRNYRKAGEIYRAEAERLLSRGRKDKLAAIYLEFAHRYFKGIPAKDPSAKPKPVYTQALAYYQEALKLEPSIAVRHDVEPRIGRCFHELGKHGTAGVTYRKYLDKYAGDKTKDADRTPVNTEVEVRFQLGRSQLVAGQRAEARKTWQDLVQQKPGFLKKPGFSAAERLADATYQIARTFGMPAPGTVGDLELGVAALERFLKEYPNHKLAPQAEFDIAQGYAHHGRYDQAIAQLKALIGNEAHAESKQVADARKLLGDSYFAQKKFVEAIAAWREFLDKHPTNAGWANVQRLVINSEFQMGEEERRQKNYVAARKQWETFLNKYPLDSRAAQLLLRFGEMNYAAAATVRRKELDGKQLDDDAPDSRRVTPAAQKLFDLAIADWKRLVSKYPGSNEASRASYLIGVTLEDRLGRLSDALEAYRKVAEASQSAARKRIAGLTSHRLEVVTDRKYRTNERAKIKLRTRNLEKVTVAVYRIDMVDYFRKMHLAGGIESLDIALIDPDNSWEYKIDGYEKYRQLTNEIEIPLEGPGVSAVTITGDKLEATTMVIVSDIDVIVKSSRNEFFVFAENMLTGKPVQGVSLLVSDGSKVFAEELTNKDGIVQHVCDELKTVGDLRVFAIYEGHAASSVTSLKGLDFAVGLAPKGYLYSDRPAYRAGQLVHLKGVIRWVDGDRFVFKEGEQYSLDVYDSRGRVIHTQKTKLNKWGTFAENFTLPSTAPQGNYRVHLHQAAGKPSYETSFQVHDYKLEPIQLAVELPRKVFYRGENITGTILLKYYYGTPLAGRTIQYQLADDRLHTATTDDKGEVAFEFETRRFSESQALQLNVTFPERNLRTVESILLATRGLDIGVTTLRNVYIAGETFDATFNVAAAAGKSAGADLTLDVLEQTRVDGKQGERSIQTFDVKSDEKTGEVRQTLRIDKSGRYIVRATATDRFGNRVSGQKTVIISGDDDTIRLRILAEKHHYQLGDTAKVQLHWREDPALALVTFEGAKILGYRLVQLKTGANPLEIPLESRLAPNFRLSVAVMQGDRFHQANSEFRIARQLKIALKPNKTTLGPGEELTVEITVTDPQGKPVSAEVSLGLVQKNLLDYFGSRAGLIDEYFGSGYRRPSVRATTSCTFRYLPKTRGVNQFLLAEAERERIEAAESAASNNLTRGLFDSRAADNDARAQRKVAELSRIQAQSRRAQNEARQTLVINGELSNLVDQYNVLFGQRRYAEAEVLAKQAAELDPDNPVAATMGWKAKFARRNGRNGNMSENDFSEELGIVILTDGLPNSIVFSADGRHLVNGRGQSTDLGDFSFGRVNGGNFRWGGQLGAPGIAGQSAPGQMVNGPGLGTGANGQRGSDADFDGLIDLIQQETSGNWADINGNGGTIQEYETTLSLIIRQDQSIDPQVAAQFFDELANTKRTIVAVNNEGNYQVINGLNEGQLKAFGKNGMRVLPHMAAAETGYWNPVVVTGVDGKTTVSFRLPDRSTAWKLQSRGINAETLSGQAEVEIIARKDLFGSLKTPLAFAQGDKAQLLAEIHNAVIKKGEKILVKLKATNGDKSTEQKRTVISKGPGIAEVTFPIDIADGSQIEFELTVTSGEQTDVSRTVIPIRPFGLPVFATAGGSAAQNTLAFIGHDEKLAVQERHLEIVIGPSINRTLLDAVLGSGLTAFDSSAYLPRSGLERAVSDVIGGIGLLKMTGGSRTADTPEAQALSGRIQSAVGQLVSAQRDDGGWSWSGRPSASKSDRYLSSRMVWALSSARSAGYAVPSGTFDKAVQFLRTAFTATNPADREAQAIILHGLAEAGVADFAFANRLYRERNNLSPSGLLHVALVLAKLDRKQMAGELLDLVKIPIDADMANGSKADSAIRGCIPWMQTGVELRALYLLALEDVAPTDAKAAKLADWLLAARRGTRWTPEKANGPAIAALADWFSRTKQTGEKYTLSVFVNDRLVEKIAVDPSTDGSRRLKVPDEFLVADKPQQRINFDIEGRGRFSYSAVLSGFVPADKLKATTNDWRVVRSYEPAQLMLDGKLIPRGFGIATRYSSFRNPLTQLPMGERGEVTLQVRRNNVRGVRDEQFDYLVVVEPIPAGTMVLRESIRGSFERFEIAPGTITFYVGDMPYPGDIRYTLVGYLPGSYRAAPTVVRSFYRPERIAIAKSKSLALLARGEKSADEYKLTPVERYEFGKRLIAKGEHAAASEHLTALFTGWQLKSKVYQEVVRLLFTASLAIGKDDAIVEYFEIIKERYPEVEIDFDSILRVAAAYRELGEYERSYLVYRATVEGSFQRESQIAGFLDARGEFVRAVQVLENVLRQYPAESYIATATYSLAGEVYGKAAEAAANAKLRDAKITRVDLIAASIEMFDHFLSTWPTDPAADQVSFSMASAYLDLERYEATITRCEKFAERYPDSQLLDSFWYVIGYSQFALSRHDEALKMCRKVAEWKRKDRQAGVDAAALNKWQAIYIMGQVYHSLGKPAEAITEYERVGERFADAAEAIRFFNRKAIELPEVTTVKPGDMAGVKLSFRNVATANVKVYRIDLLKFGLMQRNLNRITAINLAGIRPYHELDLKLGDGKDYKDRNQEMKLPLKEEGAYLVVCRGENLYASGLVLVSPLVLDVQEDVVSGRVRVTVKDDVKNQYTRDVHVKVIGTRNSDFTSGETDLRGIFVADAIGGQSTVIARAGDDRYAFYRGKTSLRPQDEKKKNGQPAAPQSQQKPGDADKDDLLRNIRGSNGSIQLEQRSNYKNLLRNNDKGVKANKAF
jgi:uncharacterized protein YfaS (alpha-2-macroglobulin family)/outer membrane protein assembly factor BamD (BamD/ComL family)